MNDCDWLERVGGWGRGDVPDRDVIDHLEGCAECRELERMVRLFQDEARVMERSARGRLPDPRAVIAAANVRAVPTPPTPPVLWPVVWAEGLGVAGLALVMVGGLALIGGRWPGSGWPGAEIVEWLQDQGMSLGSAFAAVSPRTDPVSMALWVGVVAIVLVAVHGLAGPGRGLR